MVGRGGATGCVHGLHLLTPRIVSSVLMEC